jgi:hypothetical protein
MKRDRWCRFYFTMYMKYSQMSFELHLANERLGNRSLRTHTHK